MIEYMSKTGTFIAGFITGVVVLWLGGQLFDKDTNKKVVDMPTATSTIKINGVIATTTKATDTVAQVVTQKASSKVVQHTKVDDARMVSDAITVENQHAGKTVTVKSVNLQAGTNGGWVVVHEIKNGVVANALGAVRRDSGVSNDVVVRLLRGTVAGGMYAVVLYNDNGDRHFNFATDFPLKGQDGKYVMSIFTAQ